ncbi:MAG: hypothetical protein DF168_02099 [Candidatus Moanabacter tarae]|uniref:Uncharacterized protein n=1 Tax=Candidatus Moanibacter tarae TaxID=2200854 RepID=A0A2Z4AGQ9_9BACT|nr:MAG: hypothetical protein DF168_02099 [Candidatus Moanabacter tarae]
MDSSQGSSYPRTSPLRSEWETMNPILGEYFSMSVPEQFYSIEREREYLKDLALCDLSAFPKIGIKGDGATEWLEQQEIKIPKGIYQHLALPNNGLVVRLDHHEYFLEEGFEGTTVKRLSGVVGEETGRVFYFNRQDASLLLCGNRALDVLQQSCSFDFSGDGSNLTMTQVAGVSCMVLPMTDGFAPGFRIWLIPSYAIYLWRVLFEIVRDCNGHAVGMGSVRDFT